MGPDPVEPMVWSEEWQVRRMRYLRLRALGLTLVEARLLADDLTVNLHEAEHLIRDLGCPLSVAARILI